jgi:hypothetical protein
VRRHLGWERHRTASRLLPWVQVVCESPLQIRKRQVEEVLRRQSVALAEEPRRQPVALAEEPRKQPVALVEEPRTQSFEESWDSW